MVESVGLSPIDKVLEPSVIGMEYGVDVPYSDEAELVGTMDTLGTDVAVEAGAIDGLVNSAYGKEYRKKKGYNYKCYNI